MDLEQTIEQPMFAPSGDTDSLVVLLPVSEMSTASVPAASTSVTVTEVVTISTAELDKHIRAIMDTCGQLVAERDRVTAEIRRQAKDVLHPALIEMRKRYNNPGARTDLLPGILTFEAYLRSIRFCSSILRVWDHRRRQKELEGLLPSDGQKRIGSGSSGRPAGSSSPMAANPDDVVVGDATSALVNLGFRRSDAKQAIGQALTADPTLANDLDGLLRSALGGQSQIKPATGYGNADPGPAEREAASAAAGKSQVAPIIAEYEQTVAATDSDTATNENDSTSDSNVVIKPTESDTEGVRLVEDGFLVVTTPAPTLKATLFEHEVGSNQNRGTNATLRDVFNRMADTTDIENALQDTLQKITLPMLDQHPYMQIDTPFRPKLEISVTFYRAGRARISAGDWVEYRGGDNRLTKQIGAEAALGRVVEADAFSRPRITWFNGTKWMKPYALFDEEAVHVLFADQAASAYPGAFDSYSEPTAPKRPAAVPTMEADASASIAPSAVAAPAVSAGDPAMEDARENPVLSNAISPSPAESLAEDTLPVRSAGPVARGFLPHWEATCTQLVPGKKYQVRPAPSGGYGIYEPHSTILLKWYAEEDDARDAIDQLQESALVA